MACVRSCLTCCSHCWFRMDRWWLIGEFLILILIMFMCLIVICMCLFVVCFLVVLDIILCLCRSVLSWSELERLFMESDIAHMFDLIMIVIIYDVASDLLLAVSQEDGWSSCVCELECALTCVCVCVFVPSVCL